MKHLIVDGEPKGDGSEIDTACGLTFFVSPYYSLGDDVSVPGNEREPCPTCFRSTPSEVS